MSRLAHVAFTQIVVRAVIVVAALAALGCTRAAGSSVEFLEIAIAAAALVCVWMPDSHLPAATVVLAGAHWLIAVDDPATPWAIGAGAALGSLHLAAAASGVGPLAAHWTTAMRRRWISRSVLAAGATIPAWAIAALADGADIGGTSVLVAAALLAVAGGLLASADRLGRSEA